MAWKKNSFSYLEKHRQTWPQAYDCNLTLDPHEAYQISRQFEQVCGF